MLALGSARHLRPYRDSFEWRTTAGTNKMDPLVAIGCKRLSTSYMILKTGYPYDPACHAGAA
jgi:hypothetical protein